MNIDVTADTALAAAYSRADAGRKMAKAAPVMHAALTRLVDAHSRGMAPTDSAWREAIGALAQARSG